MNYYDHHIGDYAKKAGHLTILEDGVYCRFLRIYYDTEAPLMLDLEKLRRKVGARTPEELTAFDAVLNEFFVKEDDGYHQGRCDESIAKYRALCEHNRTVGARGGRPKRAVTAVEPENNPDGYRVEPERNPLHTPDTIHQLIPSSNEDLPTATLPPCPTQKLLAVFGEQVPELSQPRRELWDGSAGAEAMRQRWKWLLSAKRADDTRYAETTEQGIDWFGRFFQNVAASDFLTGRAGKWKADLSWLMKKENFAKVVQGNYANKEATP